MKVFTEALEHELRNTEGGKISAHLLIPGFVFTGLTKGDRAEKPAAAWTAEQTVDFMVESLERGDFYILCPDNDVAASGRRDAACLGGRRYRREPPAAVALAQGLRRQVQGLPRTEVIGAISRFDW